MARVPLCEQETIIRWAPDEDVVHIYTAHPATKRKIERYGHKPVRSTSRDGAPTGWFFDLPAGQFRWQARKRRAKKVATPGPESNPMSETHGPERVSEKNNPG